MPVWLPNVPAATGCQDGYSQTNDSLYLARSQHSSIAHHPTPQLVSSWHDAQRRTGWAVPAAQALHDVAPEPLINVPAKMLVEMDTKAQEPHLVHRADTTACQSGWRSTLAGTPHSWDNSRRHCVA